VAVSKPEESHLRKTYALLASSLGQIGQHDEAWQACQHGLALYPDDKELLFRCAFLHHHFGRLADAESVYLRVLNGREERHFSSIEAGLASYKARHNLAIVYDDMACPDKAEEQWRLVVAEVPHYLPGWRGLGEALLRQAKTAAVTELIGTLIAQPNTRVTGRMLEYRLCAAWSDLIGARRALEAALSESPGELEPLRALCRLLFERGAPAEAEPALMQLTELQPTDADAWHNLGTVRCQIGDYAGAASAYAKSMELRPDAGPTRRQFEFAAARARPAEKVPSCPI
jgi:tetratricopeptide (TPR) repeat protein